MEEKNNLVPYIKYNSEQTYTLGYKLTQRFKALLNSLIVGDLS